MTSLAFYVVAPEAQTKTGIHNQKLNRDAIRKAVKERAESFSSELGNWVDEWFFPTLEKIHIEALSWESLIECIKVNDSQAYHSMLMFYDRVLLHNGPRQKFVSSQHYQTEDYPANHADDT